MEKTLQTLFGFQRFEENADLQRLIDRAHMRYTMRDLSPDEMEKVAAAGAPLKGRKPGDQQRE